MKKVQLSDADTKSAYVSLDTDLCGRVADRIYKFGSDMKVGDITDARKRAWAVHVGLCYLWQAQKEKEKGDVSAFNEVLVDCQKWAKQDQSGGDRFACPTFKDQQKIVEGDGEYPDLEDVLENVGATFCLGARARKRTAYVSMRVGLKYYSSLKNNSLKWVKNERQPWFSLGEN